MEAVNQNGMALMYASERLKGDRSIAVLAIKKDPWMLKEVKPNMQAD